MNENEKKTPSQQPEAAAQPEDARQQQDTQQPESAAQPAKQNAAPEKGKKKGGSSAAQMAAEAEADKLRQQLDESRDQYQRVLAEYANYKRRTEQEKEQLGLFTKAEILRELLTPLDNMERAIEAPAGDEYKTGVDMTLRQFKELLQKLGLEEIPAMGAAFDPALHHAVMREDADGAEPDTVTEVFQKGYRLGDRVLRPAMVKVAN